ncbi:hypothetical protein AK88_02112 [Plasmodium fragile]|uniref:Uncharacterized protein n=1 Tax=Plasmodium fragile TaxID=5857 RepID=A0A0D9QM75_PLAFR|nr:uncharacterized protein AK88_02112 [Plasmodium fragile]KJP88165.1 hypothetical protein AK88_02112 [Plasmodium fragile]
MNESKTNGEKNLLIYDKSSKVGCIYFIGISSNFYRGRVILKKNCISDRIVRYTNLSENLLLIKNGNYNFKQTAILIKGITIFLHRQLEVLLTDFYAMYKKCLLSSLNEYRLQKRITKKCKANRRHRAKKNVLSLQDGEPIYGNNYSGDPDDGTFRRKKTSHINKNKNIAHINDLMLKESNELYEHDYHFEHEDIPNDENMMYNDMLTNTSSFNYSKYNNLYTINNGVRNINTKESSRDANMQSNLKNTAFLKYNMLDIKRDTSAERNNYSNDSLLLSKTLDKKNFSFNVMNSSLLFSGNIAHGKVSNNLGANHNGDGNIIGKDDNTKKGGERPRQDEKKNKRIFAQIDKDTILRHNIWEENKTNKTQKSDNQFSTHLTGGSYIFFLLYNDVKNGPSDNSISSSFHSYEQAKNFINFDTRKDVYNVFGNDLIQNEKINMQPNNLKLLQTKSTVSSINERKNKHKNHLNFEQLRVNFNDEYFLNHELQNNHGGKSYSHDSFGNSYDQMDYNFDQVDYNFDRMSSFPQKIYEHRKSQPNGGHKNKSGKEYKDVYNFSDTFKDSLSVPSSKLVSRRSFTSSEYKYNEELIKLKNYLHKISANCSNVIEFDRIFPVKRMSDKNISIIFYNLLVLASNAEVDVTQNYPDSKILIQVC